MKVFPVSRQKWVLGLHQRFLTEGGSLGGEWEVIRRDGCLLHVWSESAAVVGEDGIKRRMVYVKDISERKRLELTAKQFESIVQSSDDAIISKSIDGTITSWNMGAQYMFGYTASEMIGKSIMVLLPDELKYEEEVIISRLLSGKKIQHFETIRQHKDGHRVQVSVTISPIRDDNGVIIGASKIARDITERKILESQLALTSSVFTHTNEGIVVSDANGVVVEVNPAFTRITGYQREDVMGQKPLMFLSERQDTDLLNKIAMSLQTGNYYQGEVWSKKKDGIHFAVLLNINTVRDAKGGAINYIAIFSDITLLQMKQEQIEHLAHFDALTDLPNRSLLADRLQQAMMITRRQQQKLAVLYMDLDGFKTINDTYGHAAGDALLVMVSGRMKAAMRESDTLARMGEMSLLRSYRMLIHYRIVTPWYNVFWMPVLKRCLYKAM
jgi:PAS domain S-box-containing protein